MASGRERRVETRYKVTLRATVSSPESKEQMPCLIRDASRSGCRIVASKAHRLPDHISLHIESLSAPIEGTVVWRSARMAGVHFDNLLSADILETAEPVGDEIEEPPSTAEGKQMQDIAKRFSSRRVKH